MNIPGFSSKQDRARAQRLRSREVATDARRDEVADTLKGALTDALTEADKPVTPSGGILRSPKVRETVSDVTREMKQRQEALKEEIARCEADVQSAQERLDDARLRLAGVQGHLNGLKVVEAVARPDAERDADGRTEAEARAGATARVDRAVEALAKEAAGE